MEPGNPETEARLAQCREKLLIRRSERVRPGFDDKVLADWNGLMIAALVRAGLAFGEPKWIEAAEKAFLFVCDKLGFERDGLKRLHHSYRAGRARHPAVAEDYANMARAALLLEEARGHSFYLQTAKDFSDTLDRHYWDQRAGGYCLTADDSETLLARSRFAMDNPVPNANGTMIEVHTRLYHRTGLPHHRARAQALVHAFAGDLQRHAMSFSAYLNGYDFLLNSTQIIILGHRGEPGTEALAMEAHKSAPPAYALAIVAPDDKLPDTHPAAGKTLQDGKPTAYVCRGTTCSLPVTAPEALADLLRT